MAMHVQIVLESHLFMERAAVRWVIAGSAMELMAMV